MEKKNEGLEEEILRNARSDRKTVEKVRDDLIKMTDLAEVQAEAMSMVVIAENVCKLSDVLTKVNAQLVELHKVSLKNAPADDNKKPDSESIFDEIEASGTEQTN